MLTVNKKLKLQKLFKYKNKSNRMKTFNIISIFLIMKITNINTFIINIPKILLDIGCRNGESTMELSRNYPDTKIIGIDIDIDDIITNRTKKNYPNISFLNINSYNDICKYLNETNQFELIQIRGDVYSKYFEKDKKKKVMYYLNRILNENGKIQIYSETITI
jgi:tRNA G46 methylase TrmB